MTHSEAEKIAKDIYDKWVANYGLLDWEPLVTRIAHALIVADIGARK